MGLACDWAMACTSERVTSAMSLKTVRSIICPDETETNRCWQVVLHFIAGFRLVRMGRRENPFAHYSISALRCVRCLVLERFP